MVQQLEHWFCQSVVGLKGWLFLGIERPGLYKYILPPLAFRQISIRSCTLQVVRASGATSREVLTITATSKRTRY